LGWHDVTTSQYAIHKWQEGDCIKDRFHRPAPCPTCSSQRGKPSSSSCVRRCGYPRTVLLAITREFINPAISHAGLGRCLRRHGVSQLNDLMAQESEAVATKRTFKDYEPGFNHISIKYLSRMPDKSPRYYLFVAIDLITRCIFMEIYDDESDDSSVDFPGKVKSACPAKIVTLLTDNGSQFSDCFTNKKEDAADKQIASANNWTSNITSFGHAIRKQTAW
jgi:hypothetical protein